MKGSPGDPWSEGFPRLLWEGFPRPKEGFSLEFAARPSDVSLGEWSRCLLILGSTRLGWFGNTLRSVCILGCPIDELGSSALSASPRRLTEGVLEDEVPTSADTVATSCLLFNAEPVFRRLRDDLFDEIFLVCMVYVGLSNASCNVECRLVVEKQKLLACSSLKLRPAKIIIDPIENPSVVGL